MIWFEKLEEKDSYYNAFFRIKQEMLKYDIISYKKNRYKYFYEHDPQMNSFREPKHR